MTEVEELRIHQEIDDILMITIAHNALVRQKRRVVEKALARARVASGSAIYFTLTLKGMNPGRFPEPWSTTE